MDNPNPLHTKASKPVAKNLWKALLEVSRFARNNPKPSQRLALFLIQDQWQVYADNLAVRHTVGGIYISTNDSVPTDSQEIWFGWKQGYLVSTNESANAFDQDQLFRQYLGYALLPWQAAAEKRCITVTHFAQSLDGKIATHTGHSRWIGNDENLLHAHRMRALCEGILIGKGTLISDDPALTTRHVEGPNPRRIVVSSTPCNFESLLNSSKEEIWWVGGKEDSEYIRCILTEKHPIETRCERLLQTLFEKGIKTVFIEGGSVTTSAFLAEGMIDIMQFHISPMVFGSGIPGINLPEIAEVGESVKFDSWKFFPVGDAVMFVGKPANNDS